MANKIYTDEVIATINSKLAGKSEVAYAEVEALADELGIPTKSLAPKLRSLGYVVGKKAQGAPEKAYTPEQEALIKEMVNRGYFIEDIAAKLGKTVPQIRGKLLSMKLSAPLKNKKEPKPKIYTPELIEQIKGMINSGKDIATIASELSLNEKGLKTTLAKLGLIPKATKGKFWTEERKKAAIDLYNSTTESIDKLAEKFGTSYPQFAKILHEAGIDYAARKPVKKFKEQ